MDGVQLSVNWDGIDISAWGPVFGDLMYLPIEGCAVAAFGPRADASLFSVHLQWLETHSPHWPTSRPMQPLI